MKFLFPAFSVGAIMFFILSCKDNRAMNKLTLSTSIAGTWELRQAQSSMIPTKDYSAGNGNIFKFSDSVYERYTNGSLVKSGHYSIITDSSVMAEVGLEIPAGQFANRIIFDRDFASPKTFIELSNNRLTMISGYFPTDGGSRVSYEKQANNR